MPALWVDSVGWILLTTLQHTKQVVLNFEICPTVQINSCRRYEIFNLRAISLV